MEKFIMGVMAIIMLASNPALPQEDKFRFERDKDAPQGALHDEGASVFLPPDKPVLFVVHGNEFFDPKKAAKPGIDAAVKHFKNLGWPVVYLMVCPSESKEAGDGMGIYSYMEDAKPTVIICTGYNGTHRIHMRSNDIFITGGYAGDCALDGALRAANESISEQLLRTDPRHSTNVNLYYILDAVYTEGGSTMQQELERSPDPKNYLFSVLKPIYSKGGKIQNSYDDVHHNTAIRLFLKDSLLDEFEFHRYARQPVSSRINIYLTTTTNYTLYRENILKGNALRDAMVKTLQRLTATPSF